MHFKSQPGIDNYEKDGGPGAVCLHVDLTMILGGTNFCVWLGMKLIFTSQLQIAPQIPCSYLISKSYDLK